MPAQKRIERILENLLSSYDEIGGINHIEGPNLPSRESLIRIVLDFESLLFPGFYEESPLGRRSLHFRTAETLSRLAGNLIVETEKCICFRIRTKNEVVVRDRDCVSHGEELAKEILELLPALRARIRLDVDAAFRGDPAAKSFDEVILAYPGVEAIIVHRIAHEFWIRDIPLLPRMMSEYIHGKTGIDIHPGATIGPSFFIDHGTGVVVGETTVIGENVKLYQGVTLGALSVKKEEADVKRHPTIESDVTIYAGATILGGGTTIGKGSIIGGNVWLTTSVPAYSRIYTRPGEYISLQRNVSLEDYQI